MIKSSRQTCEGLPFKELKMLKGYVNFSFLKTAGPLSHAVRPDSYIKIDNFYTSTVYEKGAEIVRMLKTLLGPDHFRAGCDLYFKKLDGLAVTIEDFINCFEEASGHKPRSIFVMVQAIRYSTSSRFICEK